ncbi:MAG: hypothetical protein BWY06_02771 [Candidatus Latescibacteria bacterium ADurb.Bin168]|nr:MAG: hypothetical protein BWY06_02771 [Candidatus Latescibacteria bacterium ADurb.Bin168]
MVVVGLKGFGAFCSSENRSARSASRTPVSSPVSGIAASDVRVCIVDSRPLASYVVR